MSAIELSAVGKAYEGTVAVDGISLTVEPGEFVTILGPSGSGKTTMLSLIAGLIEPTAGRISIAGRDVTHIAPGQRNVGLVFQSYALFPNMTVFGNVAFPLDVRKVAAAEIRRRVEEALRLVRLTGLEARYPSQLSGGQQQRVALARAVVFAPSILLLDEPLAALDRKLREDVRHELRHLQRTLGLTTLLVTHDQDEALSLSDRLLVLDQGKVQQIGRPEEVYLRPATRFVADFLGAANLLEGVVQQQGGQPVIVMEGGVALPAPAIGAPPGSAVTALLRPERLRLEPSAGKGLPATLTECVYHGQSVRYHLRLRNGVPVVATAPDAVPRFAPPASIDIAWSPEDLWIIPAQAPLAPPQMEELKCA